VPKSVTIMGAPRWFDEPYDIDARAEGAGEITSEVFDLKPTSEE